MKKIITGVFALSLIISFTIFSSCKKNSNASTPADQTIINSEDTPDITPDIFAELGFTNFAIDYTRNVTLNKNKEQLIIPYNGLKSTFAQHLYNNKSEGVGVCIKIATRKSNCSQGIGFRCGLIKDCFKPKKQELQQSGTDKLSRDRVQPVKIIVDKTNSELIFQFVNKIDWKYLKNN